MTGSSEWMDRGACTKLELPLAEVTRMFFPEKGGASLPAKRVCARCPVIAECRVWALERGSTLGGVWGGLSENQRRKIIHDRNEAKQARGEEAHV